MTQAHIPAVYVCTSDAAPFVEVRQSLPSQVAVIFLFVDQLMYLLLAFIGLCLIVPCEAGAQNTSASGAVEGTVFVVDSGGASYVPGAKVVLTGSTTLETETDSESKYTIPKVKPGSYTIEASLSSLQTFQTITVEASGVVQVALELKPAEVKTSATVTDTYPDANAPPVQ